MYDYQKEKPYVFTDEGQRQLLRIRDTSFGLFKLAGVARCQEMMAGESGSSWQILACVDRLVEIGDIVEIKRECAGQHRIFLKTADERR